MTYNGGTLKRQGAFFRLSICLITDVVVLLSIVWLESPL